MRVLWLEYLEKWTFVGPLKVLWSPKDSEFQLSNTEPFTLLKFDFTLFDYNLVKRKKNPEMYLIKSHLFFKHNTRY